MVTLPSCVPCQLSMKGIWHANYFQGFGLIEVNKNPGSSKTVDFQSPGCGNTPGIPQTEGYSSSKVTVAGGTYFSEIRWSIRCGNSLEVTEFEGIAPYSEIVTLPRCTPCRLDMRDVPFGDSWSGNNFMGFRMRETVTMADNGGRSKSVPFNSGRDGGFECAKDEVVEVEVTTPTKTPTK